MENKYEYVSLKTVLASKFCSTCHYITSAWAFFFSGPEWKMHIWAKQTPSFDGGKHPCCMNSNVAPTWFQTYPCSMKDHVLGNSSEGKSFCSYIRFIISISLRFRGSSSWLCYQVIYSSFGQTHFNTTHLSIFVFASSQGLHKITF